MSNKGFIDSAEHLDSRQAESILVPRSHKQLTKNG